MRIWICEVLMIPEPLREEPKVDAGLGVSDVPPPAAPEPEPQPEPEPRAPTPPPLPPRPGQRPLTPPPVPPRPHAQARLRAREMSPPPRALGLPQNMEWIHRFRRARRDEQRGRGDAGLGRGQNIDRPGRQLDEDQILFLQRLGVRQRREFLDMILDGQFPLPNEAFENPFGDFVPRDVPIEIMEEDMGFFDDDGIVDDEDGN
ncbi:Protein CBG15494 [Caenorhabditis briggsae]|uniref:Protein CBG15494 n=1 Tax=Caenorhabditis briggsae TaxID=6238 RepID=A8XM72_CAEBR|nr:Protein CBG15494 [Caenorhabditis briggsae]CAP33747.2 Protein CBG15494 [Caenorhabditis briggsae]